MALKAELESRGLLYQLTDEKVFEKYDKGGQKFYCGYDPTADSLHLGHFLTLMTATRLMQKGNIFYLLVGGATGFIGDPSGKESARALLDEAQLRHNQEEITQQVKGLLENIQQLAWGEFEFKVVNNYDFIKDMNVFDFFAKIGRYITVNTMISKESIKKRIEDPNLSITYTEFSYMLLQGHDFLYLFENEGVHLKIGGSDQWGNMVTGTEMIRKKLGNDVEADVMTIPLMLDSTGKKFWKSEGNAIWMDPTKNSPYFVYQYFMNTVDADVARFLKAFTLLSLEEIDEIVKKHEEAPELRYGQKRLADYLIEVIFGKAAREQANKISEILFGNSDKMQILSQMNPEELQALAHETGKVDFQGEEMKLIDLLVLSWIATSNGDAKKLIQSGSISFNEEKQEDIAKVITKSDLKNGVGLLRKGKKSYKVILQK